jgi:predicted SAM-dependent methyltransferase
VRVARRAAERAVTPEARIAIDRIDHSQAEFVASLAQIEHNMPAVLNAISSTNGAARLATRDAETLAARCGQLESRLEELRAGYEHGDLAVLGQVRPHVETLAWLMQRVETVRFEMLNELRYGTRDADATAVEPRVVNPAALDASPLRVNIGAGHIPLEGYVNVDMRELPGIDVVATIDALPFEPGSLDEIHSSHTLEHFPEELLRRQLLPYWVSLLKPGGVITSIVPDLEAMSNDYVKGVTSFEDFRSVLYGGQEYEGDTHFTGFTPHSLSVLLEEAGLVDPYVVACDRVNGRCKEFEITARKVG